MFKRAIAIGITLAIAGPFCIVALYYCQFYHALYRDTGTEFSQFSRDVESHLGSIDYRLSQLESHKPRHPIPTYIRGIISTTDVGPSESWTRHSTSLTNGQPFQIVQDKDGLWIVPELRLQTGSTNRQTFDIQVNPGFGTVTEGWLSHTEPYDQLASLEQFHLYTYHGTRTLETNVLHLSALAKPGKSFQMEFTTVILLEH
jgi:hypothetical protein